MKKIEFDIIKNLFIRNSQKLTIGVILGISTLVSLYYWSNHQIYSINDSSLKYEDIVYAIRTNHMQTLTVAEKFAESNRNNIYGTLTFLEIAQKYVENNELEKANEQLKKGLSIANDNNLKAIINLRLARIRIQQERADEALKILNSIKEEGFSLIITNIREEALLSKRKQKSVCNP